MGTHEQSGPNRVYTISMSGGRLEQYFAYVEPREMIKPLIDYVRAYEEADWIAGLGDEAYLQVSDAGPGYDLTFLVEGQFGITINGPGPDVMQAAARLLIERVGW